jgi:hypothetical protein
VTLRHLVLLLLLIVLMFEGDLVAQRVTSANAARRAFAVCWIPLAVTAALVFYRRWHGFG